jgi:tyrosine-specific transport protein
MAKNKFGKNFWLAVFSLVGTTIGAGIFGLPYVFAKAGFFVGLIEFIILVGIILLIQQMLGEVALRTPGKKRLIGYVEKYLNPKWKSWIMTMIFLGSIGVLLVYIILGGEFLSALSGRDAFWSSTIFFTIWFLAILARPKIFGRVEFYISFFVISIIVLISLINLGNINLNNFKTLDLKNLLLPYGVILFAISGYTVIPEMEDILGNKKSKLKKAITCGTLIPAIVYLIFVFIVLGISGKLTSQDAISGLALAINSKNILLFGSLLGLLAVSGAALSYGIYAKETLRYDLKLNKWLAWILTGFVPFFLFLLGARNLILIIGLVGAIIFAFQVVIILLIHKKAKFSQIKPAYEINLPSVIYYILGVLAVLGALLQIWYNLG